MLAESQRLATELQARSGELQARQDELQSSNAELEDKAVQLARQNRDIEHKNAEIEQARQEIEERARQLDLASRYKSQFLANMSHELRTPLNSLLVLARLLAQNPDANLTGKQVEYANVIYSSGSDLLQLINDILDLSKVEAGKMDIHPERFALDTLAEDLYSVFGPLTTEKGLRFTIEPADDAPRELVTDRQRLRQILHNLLSNAVKFTEHGDVRLSIAPAATRGLDGADGAVLFSVSDTGIGISAENLASIFSAFQQGDGTTSRRYGGTGLGLAICREVAAQLGGDIRVESGQGAGSTFSLYLPMSQDGAIQATGEPDRPGWDELPHEDGNGVFEHPAAAAALPPPAATSHDRLRDRKVLIVDDDPRNAFVLTDALELYGMTVVRAADGRQAISELGAGDIDVVLMDIMMPQMDGYQTTQAIRQMPNLAQLPVIAVTARAMQGDREKSIAAGATDHVTKPVDIEELVACIERSLTAPAGEARS